MKISLYETAIIITALGALTVSVCLGAIDQNVYAGLMGAFLGYTFGRIFNNVQRLE